MKNNKLSYVLCPLMMSIIVIVVCSENVYAACATTNTVSVSTTISSSPASNSCYSIASGSSLTIDSGASLLGAASTYITTPAGSTNTNFTNNGTLQDPTDGSISLYSALGTVNQFSNNGTISNSSAALASAVKISSSVGSFSNTGYINGTKAVLLGSQGAASQIGSVSNSGNIIANGDTLLITGQSIGTVSNSSSGNIINTNGGIAVGLIANSTSGSSTSTTTSLINSGTISGVGSLVYVGSNMSVGSITNNGIIQNVAGFETRLADGISLRNSSSVGSIVNSLGASIKYTGSGIVLYNNTSSTIGSITNYGEITPIATALASGNNNDTGDQGASIFVGVKNKVTTITNMGSMHTLSELAPGIFNKGTITNLNNSQGAGNPYGALSYKGILPENYNIIINSATDYGRLTVNGASSGVMNLGIVGNSSLLAEGSYNSIISGITSANGLSSASIAGLALSSNVTDSVGKVWYISYTNSTTGTYDLNVFSGANQNITTNGLRVSGLALSGLGTTVASALDGGIFVVDGNQSKSNAITVSGKGGTIDQAGNSATLSGVISDLTTGGKLIISNSGPAGAGSVTLSGTNTYTGGTTVNEGANLSIGSASNLGASTGSLNLVGSSTTPATLTTTATMTIANPITVAGDPTFNIASGTTTTVSSPITDGASAGDVVVTGGGTLALTAVNTYTGLTTINSGSTLALIGAGSIASSSASGTPIGVLNNGTFNISGKTSDTSVTSLTGGGNVVLGANRLSITAASGQLSGVVSGTGSLIVAGGEQTLSGNNTYSGGTQVNPGANLSISSANNLGTGTLNLVGSSTTPATLTTTANMTINNAIKVTADPTFNIASGTTTTVSSPITDGASAGDVVVTGGGTLALNAVNTYTGLTTINSGSTLALIGAGSIASSSASASASGTPIGVLNNGTFNIQGATATSVSVNGYSGTGSLATSISATSNTIPKLIVNGAANLTGGLVSVYANPGSYVGGTKYTLVNATGGVTGTFSNSFVTLTGGTNMMGRLSYDALDVYLTLGPNANDTQQSLTNSGVALRNAFTLQNSLLANSFSYDCTEYGANGVCISAGGRNTAVSAANGLNNTSGLLIAAYRPNPHYRIGAYVDQNLSMNNAGSTINLGNNNPLIGLFGAWNHKVDGTGAEIKVSTAYGQKTATVTRKVVGTSEPGSGGANLTSQGAQMTAKYGFAVLEDMIVSPYAGVRYTQNNMGGYTEGTSATVTAPLTYSRLNTNVTTVLAGLGASYQLAPAAMIFASAGVESDTNTANGSYAATSPYIPGLTPINFNASPVKTRPTAMLGVYYDVEKNQRLGITGIYRQEPYQGVSTTSVMAAYTVGM